MCGLLFVARKTTVFYTHSLSHTHTHSASEEMGSALVFNTHTLSPSLSLLLSLSFSLSAREEMGSTLGVYSGRLKDCVEAASIEDTLCRIGCE